MENIAIKIYIQNSQFIKGAAQSAQALRKIDKNAKHVNVSLSQFSSFLKSQITFATISKIGHGFLNIAKTSIKTTAAYERQKIALGVLLQDMQKGANLFDKIVDFAASTPLQLNDITTGTQRLLAFGVAEEEVIETMRRLGDVSRGQADTLNRLTNAYGKLRAKGKATLEKINHFTEAGVPLVDALADKYGTSTSGIFQMINSGNINFSSVKDAIKDLTDEGGSFFNMMELAAVTLDGKYSTYIDTMKNLGATIGELVLPASKKLLDIAIATGNYLNDNMSYLNESIDSIKDRSINFMLFDDIKRGDFAKILEGDLDTIEKKLRTLAPAVQAVLLNGSAKLANGLVLEEELVLDVNKRLLQREKLLLNEQKIQNKLKREEEARKKAIEKHNQISAIINTNYAKSPVGATEAKKNIIKEQLNQIKTYASIAKEAEIGITDEMQKKVRVSINYLKQELSALAEGAQKTKENVNNLYDAFAAIGQLGNTKIGPNLIGGIGNIGSPITGIMNFDEDGKFSNFKGTEQEQAMGWLNATDAAVQYADTIGSYVMVQEQRRAEAALAYYDQQIDMYTREKEYALALAEEQGMDKSDIVKAYNDQIAKVEEEKAVKEKKMAVDKFNYEKGVAIAQASIAMALGIANAWKGGEPISAAIITGLVIAATAAQIGIIASTPPPALAEGGIIPAQSGGGLYRLGEAGSAETVLPYDIREYFPIQRQSAAVHNYSTHIHVHGDVYGKDGKDMLSQAIKEGQERMRDLSALREVG